MLIEFTVGNFRSFKDQATLSMVAAKINARDPQVDQNNTFKADEDLTLLTSAAIYGANASGKSNLIRALNFMRQLVMRSSKEPEFDQPIGVSPFLLDKETEDKPSYFEVVFRIENTPYRYGFEVTQEKVISEWLFYSPKGKEVTLFLRDEVEIDPKRTFKEGKALIPLTRPNALFVSVGAQFNGEFSTNVLGWFRSLRIISGLDDTAFRNFTTNKFAKDSIFRENILNLIQKSDVGINDIQLEAGNVNDPNFFPKNMPQEVREKIISEIKGDGSILTLKSVHQKNCSETGFQPVSFDLSNESQGTQKLLYVSGPVIDALLSGKVLFIDEIEARMHTLLTRKLIGLFSSNETNPNHAQLIFATHDTNLLSNKIFRRDQIWFVEKDEMGASHLYSLAELKIRNDRSFESDYLEGRYGGIPILGEMRQTMIDLGKEDDHEGE